MKAPSTHELLGRAIPVLEAAAGLDALWVFGSRARHAERSDSDLDLGALFSRRIDAGDRLDLQATLSGVLGCDVDLVDLEQAPPPLGFQVVKNGTLIVDRSPARRVAFVSALPGRYQDVVMMRAPVERRLLARTPHG